MEKEIENRSKALQENVTSVNWRGLADVVLARVICFNKRRANEPAQMLVKNLLARPNWQSANSELVNSLQAIEQQLMKM